jgi:hypothetical protein
VPIRSHQENSPASIEDIFPCWWIAIVTVPLLALIIKALFDTDASRERARHVSAPVANDREEGCQYPRCGVEAREGYVLCGRGIIWADKSGKLFSLFTTIFRALENTISWCLWPAVNLAWHCGSCRIVIVDHSKLVTQK